MGLSAMPGKQYERTRGCRCDRNLPNPQPLCSVNEQPGLSTLTGWFVMCAVVDPLRPSPGYGAGLRLCALRLLAVGAQMKQGLPTEHMGLSVWRMAEYEIPGQTDSLESCLPYQKTKKLSMLTHLLQKKSLILAKKQCHKKQTNPHKRQDPILTLR